MNSSVHSTAVLRAARLPDLAGEGRGEVDCGVEVAQTQPSPSKTLLLGLGNDLLTDDAIGLRVVEAARPRLASETSISVAETTEMGLALLDLATEFEALVIVDAIQTNDVPPGFVHEPALDDLKRLPPMSPHFLGIGELLALGRELGLPVPGLIKIFAVEVQDPLTVGTKMTPTLNAALPRIVDRVVAFCASSYGLSTTLVQPLSHASKCL